MADETRRARRPAGQLVALAAVSFLTDVGARCLSAAAGVSRHGAGVRRDCGGGDRGAAESTAALLKLASGWCRPGDETQALVVWVMELPR